MSAQEVANVLLVACAWWCWQDFLNWVSAWGTPTENRHD